MDKNKNLTIEKTFNLAVKNHQEGKIDIALELYNQILKINPNHSRALSNIAVIFTNLKNYQKAKECYEKAIEINPNYVNAHNNLGVLFKELGENQKAKECYEKAIEINPNYADAHNNLGAIFINSKDYQKAKECYEKAIEINPNYVNAHNNLGVLFKELGENQKAIDCFKRANQINLDLNYVIAFAATYLKNRDPKNALPLLESYLEKYPQDARANAYRTIALRGLERFDEINKLINFSNLVKIIDTQILTNENIFEFNKELRATLINDPRRHTEKDTQGWAIRGGTVIRNLFDTKNPLIAKFEIFLRKALDYYIANLPYDAEHPFLMAKKKEYNINSCWVNFLEPGDFQSSHIHNNGWMSGVYYLDEPKIETNKENAGWIEFNRAGYNLPHFAGEKGIELIKPKNGIFIFFPSYIWHSTIPYTHKHRRVSISFDIRLI